MGAPARILARFSGENGIAVEVHEESAPYGYADLFRVRLRIVAQVPGSEHPHERTLERLGIPAVEVENTQRELLDRFRRNTLPYLLRPDFPQRFAEYHHRRGGAVIRFPASP